jgi:UDP-2,3-diacylglucosamine hydrolase
MRTIFIADAHLVSPVDANYRLLLRFLHELEGELDSLYIMGDLFDFWVGFPSHPFKQYDAVLDALERLVVRGCRLVYFEGNHDFHLGAIFSQRLKAEIHTGPAIESLQGKRL